MKYYVLDASVWVARLVPQDGFHQAVYRWMLEQRDQSANFISPSWGSERIWAETASRNAQMRSLRAPRYGGLN